MPASAVKGVIAAVSIAFGSCAGLFAASDGADTCSRALEHESQCGVMGPATLLTGGECIEPGRCFAECSLAASCEDLFDFANGIPSSAVDACTNACLAVD
jgi:hypothetical protein